MDWTGILLALGGIAGIAAAVGGWIGKLAAERIIGQWEKNREQELEELRQQIARDQAILTSAIENFSSGYQHAQERRLVAVESVWAKITELEKFYSPAAIAYMVEDPSVVLSTSTIQATMSLLTDQELVNQVSSALNEAHIYRPFLSEELWSSFVVYTMVAGGIAREIIVAVEKNSFEDFSPKRWSSSISAGPLADLKKTSETDFDFAIAVKDRMIRQMESIVSGRKSSTESLDQAVKLDLLKNRLLYPEYFTESKTSP